MTENSLQTASFCALTQCLLQLSVSGSTALEIVKVKFEILRIVSGLQEFRI